MVKKFQQWLNKKSEIKDNRMFIISLIAILFIPVLYAANFLIAFADPYNNLSEVPVAIVNDDAGTTYNGEQINLGNEFVSNLQESNNFKWYFVSDEDALNGMNANTYYFTVKIPSDFSTNIYSTLTGTATESNLIYMANDNKNYICGVLGNALVNELNARLNQKVVSSFVSTLGDNLSSGGTDIASAVSTILDGSSKVTTNLASLSSGAKDLVDNTTKLTAATNDLKSGTSDLSSNYETFDTSLKTASAGLSSLKTAYTQLDAGLSSYCALVDSSNIDAATKTTLLTQCNNLSGKSSYLLSNSTHQDLTTAVTGVNTLATKSSDVLTGINDVKTGSATLYDYMTQLQAGTVTLYQGSQALYSGSKTLTSGIGELNTGVDTFNTTVNNLNLTSNADALASPVTRSDEAYSAVDNYAYGFAPYFISLGLFVGALVTTIVLSMKAKKAKKENESISSIFKKVGLFAGIVTVQAIILDVVVLATKISVDNVFLFAIFTILMSLTFMAIVEMLSTLFGDVGRFLCIILLTLQLTACGGTFPIETAPKFYNIINPFMPMTYTVNGLREIIGSGNMSIVTNSILVMLAIIAVCYTIIVLYFKKSKKFA